MVRFTSCVALGQPFSVPFRLLLSSFSKVKGVVRSKATVRVGAPKLVAVRAPQAEVMAVPLICVSCCVTTDHAGTRRMRMASWGSGVVGANRSKPSVAAIGVFKLGLVGARVPVPSNALDTTGFNTVVDITA